MNCRRTLSVTFRSHQRSFTSETTTIDLRKGEELGWFTVPSVPSALHAPCQLPWPSDLPAPSSIRQKFSLRKEEPSATHEARTVLHVARVLCNIMGDYFDDEGPKGRNISSGYYPNDKGSNVARSHDIDANLGKRNRHWCLSK